MAITVRYGDTGDLGQMALQAGRGQDFWRRAQAEQNIVNSVRSDYRAQDQQRLQAGQLQMAAQQQASQQQFRQQQLAQQQQQFEAKQRVTLSGPQVRRDTPLSQSIIESRRLAQEQQDQHGQNLNMLGVGDVAPGEESPNTITYTDASGQQQSQNVPRKAQAPNLLMSSKQRAFAGLGVPPDLQAVADQIVADPSIDLNTGMLRIQAAMNRGQGSSGDSLTTFARTSFIMRDLSDQQTSGAKELATLIKNFDEAGAVVTPKTGWTGKARTWTHADIMAFPKGNPAGLPEGARAHLTKVQQLQAQIRSARQEEQKMILQMKAMGSTAGAPAKDILGIK